jgi:glycosyltransferase involved in cell wall biosynthesis
MSQSGAIGFDATLLRKRQSTGIERYTIELLRGLGEVVPSGRRIVVFVRPEGRDRVPPLPTNFEIVSGPTDNRVLSDQVWLPAATAHHRTAFVHHPGLAPGLWNPRPFLLTVHDLVHRFYPQTLSTGGRWYYRPLLERALRSSALLGILTVSAASARDIEREHPHLRCPIVTAANGLSSAFIPATAEAVAAVCKRHDLVAPYVLAVGTIEPRKNLAGLVEAFVRVVQSQPATLAIVGRQGWERRLNVPTSVAGAIRFLGAVSDAELRALYTGAACFAFPSFYEGFGIPLLEAMACGAPCVASNIDALREVGGEAALYTDPGRPDDLSHGILRLLNDAGLRQRLTEAGLRRAGGFSWKTTARTVYETYEQSLTTMRQT